MGDKAPDVVGAAEVQADLERELAAQELWANRYNINNFFGGREYGTVQDVDEYGNPITKWTVTDTMNPDMQAAAQSNLSAQRGLAQLGEANMARVYDAFRDPFDVNQYGQYQGLQDFEAPGQFSFGQRMEEFNFDPTGARQRAEDAAYARMTSRLDPRFESQQRQLETQLRNRGLAPGDQAYDSAMQNLGRERTDAYSAAMQEAIGMGRAETAQDFDIASGSYGIRGSALQDQFGRDITQAGYNQDLWRNLTDVDMQTADYANALQDRQLERDYLGRTLPLQETRSLLGGTMPAGQTSGGTQTAPGSMALPTPISFGGGGN